MNKTWKGAPQHAPSDNPPFGPLSKQGIRSRHCSQSIPLQRCDYGFDCICQCQSNNSVFVHDEVNANNTLFGDEFREILPEHLVFRYLLYPLTIKSMILLSEHIPVLWSKVQASLIQHKLLRPILHRIMETLPYYKQNV